MIRFLQVRYEVRSLKTSKTFGFTTLMGLPEAYAAI